MNLTNIRYQKVEKEGRTSVTLHICIDGVDYSVTECKQNYVDDESVLAALWLSMGGTLMELLGDGESPVEFKEGCGVVHLNMGRGDIVALHGETRATVQWDHGACSSVYISDLMGDSDEL